MSEFRTTRRVEFADTDMAGIVHFANFFRFMEAAEVLFLHTLGLSVRMDWEGQAIGFPRVSASCDFVKPIRFEDIVEIAVSVSQLGRKSVTYSFDFYHREAPVAKGQITCVCCRIESEHGLASIAIPEGIRAKLEAACAGAV
jgi:acyl-CoA thioester hydrolase